MKATLPLTVVLLGGVCLAVGIENPPNAASTNQSPVGESQKSQDEKAIQAATAAFVKASNAGDAKAIAALFTEDAESIDEDGTLVQGRQAIEDSFAQTFAASPGGKMEIKIDSLRFLSPDVAKEEGRCTITPAGAGGPDVDRYTVLYVKKDGKWLQSSVREHPDHDRSPHDRLKELEWLVGDWVDESDAAVVFSTCRWSEDKNFLLRHDTFQIQGRPAMTGTQRIGWDPTTGQFKSWVFDSQGGQREGLWSRGGDKWVIKMSGTLRGGKISSETTIITRVNNDMARWKSVDRTAAGQVLPDSPEFVLVRKPPLPQ
jgi:uncharacterized protein (TIGR02246 family)